MGILIGWIYQRRWFSLGAFFILVMGLLVGLFFLKGHGWWISLLAGLFVAVTIHERLRRSTTSVRGSAWTWLALPLWMGAWTSSLGFAFPRFPSAGSPSFAFVFAATVLLAVAGATIILTLGALSTRRHA